MTSEAQMALRRIMEKYESTRFILQCNDGSVIEAIQSRCTPLRFSRLSDNEIDFVLHSIATYEKLDQDQNKILDDVIRLICLCANGDLKKGIGYLQVIGNSSEKTVDAYYKIFNIPSLENINKYINLCVLKDLTQANIILHTLLNNGYNADDILDILLKVVIRREDLIYQTFYIQAISEIFIMTENCNSNTHIYALTSKLVNIAKNGSYELELLY